MRKQHGMTLIGMVAVMATLVIIALALMRSVPVYLQHYSVVQSIYSLNSLPASSLSGDNVVDVEVLRKSILKHLEINYVNDIKPEQFIIEPKDDNKFRVKIAYQVIKPFIYNVSFLFDFNVNQEVTIGSEK